MFDMSTRGQSVQETFGVSMTLTQKLRQQRDALKLRLQELEEALAAVESNPEIQRVVDSLHKLNV